MESLTLTKGQRAIGVALVAEHGGKRECVQHWFDDRADGMRVIGSIASVDELRTLRARPDVVVLLTAHVPYGRQLAIARRLRRRGFAVAVSITDHPEQASGFERLGAAAFDFADPMDRLVDEIRRVAASDAPVDTEVSAVMLSPRERHALQLYVEGHTMKDVAKELGVQFETVKTMLRRTRAKYDAAGRAAGKRSELHARAVEDGII